MLVITFEFNIAAVSTASSASSDAPTESGAKSAATIIPSAISPAMPMPELGTPPVVDRTEKEIEK